MAAYLSSGPDCFLSDPDCLICVSAEWAEWRVYKKMARYLRREMDIPHGDDSLSEDEDAMQVLSLTLPEKPSSKGPSPAARQA